MSDRAKGIILMFLTVVLWGVSFVATKVLVGYIPPITAAVLRFVLAIVVLYIFTRKIISYEGNDKWYVMLAGLFGVTLYFVSENSGLQYTTATNGSLIVSSTPIMYLVIADAIRGKRSSLMRYIGTVMAFIGVAIIVLNGRFVLKLNPLGDILVFGAALSWIFYTLFVEKLSSYDNAVLTRDISLWGLIFLLPFSTVELLNKGVSISSWFSLPAITALVYLGVFCSALGYFMWNRAIALAGGKTVTNGLYFIPIVTAIAEAIILGIYPNIYTIIGAILTITGTYIAEQKG